MRQGSQRRNPAHWDPLRKEQMPRSLLRHFVLETVVKAEKGTRCEKDQRLRLNNPHSSCAFEASSWSIEVKPLSPHKMATTR